MKVAWEFVRRQIYNFYKEVGVSAQGFFVCLLHRTKQFMTVPEAQQLYDHILEDLLASRLKEAFSGLGFLLQQNGFGKAYDKLTETETTYRYMLRYKLEGFPDPEFEKNNLGIRRQLLEMANEAFHSWMTRNSPGFYYDRIRVNRIGGSESILQLVESIRKAGERLTLVELVEQSDDKAVKSAQVLRLRENTCGQVFMRLLVSDPFTDVEVSELNNFMLDPELFEHEKALFLSALYLSLQKRFDVRKLLFLLQTCSHREVEVSQRALVLAVLVLYQYQRRLFLYPEIGETFEQLLETHPDLSESFVRVFFQCIRSKDTDKVTKRMQEEILPEMNKMGSAMQDRLRESDDATDEFNPDWQNMMENSEFSVKMQQFSDMQLEGIDVYMSTFSTQKGYSFFLDFYNWFLPFYPAHSSLSELFKGNPLEGKSVLEAVLNSDYLCSSDKYSFCFNLLQVPSNYRSSMSAQMNADSEAYDEIKKSKMGLNAKYRQEQLSNRFIQDLYRFFHLHHRRNDFINPFALPLEFHKMDLFNTLLKDERALWRIATLYFKNAHYQVALDVFERLLDRSPDDAELHQKKGYCLQHLQQPEKALESYLHAELIRPDSLWTLKRVAGLYRALHQPEKAVQYYLKAETLQSDNRSLTLQLGHALFDAENYAEALNKYFKAEILSNGSEKTWRPIAWCSFLCRKYEQAEKYYEKILTLVPTLEDFLNAGHVAWVQGHPMKAIDLYKRGIRLTHTILPDFLMLFQKDWEVLHSHGIRYDELTVLRDTLLYELEE